MKWHKTMAFLLLVVSAGAFVYTSHTMAFPIAAVALALIGFTGRFGVDISPGREIILTLALIIPFAASWRISPYNPPADVNAFLGYPLSYVFGLYFLTAQAIQFYLHRNEKIHALVVFFGAMTMVSAGNIRATDEQTLTYRILAMLFATASVLFLISSRSTTRAAAPRENLGKRTAVAILLAIALGAGAITSGVLRSYEGAVNKALSNLFFGRTRLSTTGFSPVATLDSVNRLKFGSDKNDVALRIFSKKLPPYMRGNVYGQYVVGTWRTGGGRKVLRPAVSIPASIEPPTPGRNVFLLREHHETPLVPYNVWPDPAIEHGMFSPIGTAVMDAPVTTLELNRHGVTDSGELLGGMNYIAYAPVERVKTPPSDEVREEILELPGKMDPRIVKIAETIFKDDMNTEQRIHAVIRFFNNGFSYHVGVQIPPGQDPLTYFLVNKPPAHCEYFASGATILLRMAGVPARYVAGYVPGERNTYGGYWVARNKDAHAWAEAYDDNRGWILVETTPGGGGFAGPPPWGVLRNLLDYLKLLTLRIQVAVRTEGVVAILLGALATLGWPGKVTAVLLCGALLVYLRRKRRRAQKPAAVDPQITSLQNLLARTDEMLGKQGISRDDHETLHRFAKRLTDAPDAATWYRTYATVRYRGAVTPEDVDNLRESLPSK